MTTTDRSQSSNLWRAYNSVFRLYLVEYSSVVYPKCQQKNGETGLLLSPVQLHLVWSRLRPLPCFNSQNHGLLDIDIPNPYT